MDSALNNVSLPWNAGTHVQSVAFWGTDTTSTLVLSGANTTDVILRLENPNDDETTVGAYLGGVRFSEMKVPTVTAGTAWIYLL